MRKSRKATSDEMEFYLFERGWVSKNGGWSHPALETVWPLDDAFRLQRDADTGARGVATRDLRRWAAATKGSQT